MKNQTQSQIAFVDFLEKSKIFLAYKYSEQRLLLKIFLEKEKIKDIEYWLRQYNFNHKEISFKRGDDYACFLMYLHHENFCLFCKFLGVNNPHNVDYQCLYNFLQNSYNLSIKCFFPYVPYTDKNANMKLYGFKVFSQMFLDFLPKFGFEGLIDMVSKN